MIQDFSSLFFQRRDQWETEVLRIERTKFNIDKDREKRTCDGIVFDSVMEMKYYRDVLCPLKESGDVASFELQKPFELQPKFIHESRSVQSIRYVADFYVVYSDGHAEVIDVKGCADSVAKLKRKLFWYIYPDLTYKWITYVKKWGGWIDWDLIAKKRRDEKMMLYKKEKDENAE